MTKLISMAVLSVGFWPRHWLVFDFDLGPFCTLVCCEPVTHSEAFLSGFAVTKKGMATCSKAYQIVGTINQLGNHYLRPLAFTTPKAVVGILLFTGRSPGYYFFLDESETACPRSNMGIQSGPTERRHNLVCSF